MDDILILAPTRWKLKKAIKVMNLTFNELKLEQHPDKTLIGRIERGFDFLGYHFGPNGLSVAVKTIERSMGRIIRLYEQGADRVRIGQYVTRWVGWVEAGCDGYNRKEDRIRYKTLPSPVDWLFLNLLLSSVNACKS